MSGRLTSSRTSSAAPTRSSPSRPVPASVTTWPGPAQPGAHEVALGLVVVDQEDAGRGLGHDGSRTTPRMVNSSRSRVSSSLRSSAAARGGGRQVRAGDDDRGNRGRQPGQQRAAVQAGHPHVGQDQVDGIVLDQGQRLAAVGGFENAAGQPVEQAAQDRPEPGVVVGQQDGAEPRRPQRQVEHDRGPGPGLAGQREVAAQDPGQPPGVRQAEPGAAPADAGHLVELLEDMAGQAGRYAYAGVGHDDLQPRAVYPYAQPDLAAIGVLDSVRQQVTQDAGEGNLVGQDRSRAYPGHRRR